MTIVDCFVGNRNSDISNVKRYVENTIVCMLGYLSIATSIEHYLKGNLDFDMLFVSVEHHKTFTYFTANTKNNELVNKIKSLIEQYITNNNLNSVITVCDTTVDKTIAVKLDIK